MNIIYLAPERLAAADADEMERCLRAEILFDALTAGELDDDGPQ